MPNKRALYTGGGTASYLIGNKGEPIRGELKHKLKHKGVIRTKKTSRSY